MASPDHPAAGVVDIDTPRAPILFMPGETVLVEAVVVTALATGCRLRVPGMTPGLVNYFCTGHEGMRRRAAA